jgi:hypothetical protein
MCIDHCNSLGLDFYNYEDNCPGSRSLSGNDEDTPSDNFWVYFGVFVAYIVGFVMIAAMISCSGIFEGKIDHLVTESNRNLCDLMDARQVVLAKAKAEERVAAAVEAGATKPSCFGKLQPANTVHPDPDTAVSTKSTHKESRGCFSLSGEPPELRYDYVEALVSNPPIYFATQPLEAPDDMNNTFPPGLIVSDALL